MVYRLQMKESERPDEYFGRGGVLRSRLATHGVVFPAVDTNHHLARNLSSPFGVPKSILLANADLACKSLEHVL